MVSYPETLTEENEDEIFYYEDILLFFWESPK